MRHRLVPLVCAVALATLVAASPAPVQARSAAVTSITLTGHGYGHGIGLSQYGAYGAALQKRTYPQILAHYYPGTKLSTAAGMMRVWLSKDTDRNVVVDPVTGLSVTDKGTGKVYALPATGAPAGATITNWRLSVVQGKTRVAYRTDTWRPFNPGGLVALSGNGEFAATGGVLTLRLPDGSGTSYRGRLRLTTTPEGKAFTVNTLSLDNYVRAVLPSEMPSSWPTAALRSQAVAARTYAAFERAAGPGLYYDICDSTACQVYGGRSREVGTTNAAVTATAGRVLLYGGKPAYTQFSSSNGGWSVAGGSASSPRPYLPAKQDPYDDFAKNPMHTWTKTVPAAAIQKAYPTIGTFQRLVVLKRDGHGQWRGRVLTLRLVGSKGTKDVAGTAFRSALTLRSTWFLVTG